MRDWDSSDTDSRRSKIKKRYMKRMMKRTADRVLEPFGVQIVARKRLIDHYLHDYSSYEHYRGVQIAHNVRKLNNVWADERTLHRVKDILTGEFGPDARIKGLCHGSRNGFEQNFLRSLCTSSDITGTDVSETAEMYDFSVQWDFHEINAGWVGANDFVYSNSLDQAWKPMLALQTWLNQLKPGGVLIIEHTEQHGPQGASEMDPFGVRPTVMPYVLTEWFGPQISMGHSVDKKANNGEDAWLFVVRKNVENVVLLGP